jgi:hypothetical protein
VIAPVRIPAPAPADAIADPLVGYAMPLPVMNAPLPQPFPAAFPHAQLQAAAGVMVPAAPAGNFNLAFPFGAAAAGVPHGMMQLMQHIRMGSGDNIKVDSSANKRFSGTNDSFRVCKQYIIGTLMSQTDGSYQEILPPRPVMAAGMGVAMQMQMQMQMQVANNNDTTEYRLPSPDINDLSQLMNPFQYYLSIPQRRSKVLTFLVSSLDDSIKGSYESYNKPHELNSPYHYWKAICDRYETITISQIMSLELKLNHEKLRPTDASIDEYVTRLKSLFSQLADCKEPVAEARKLRTLILGLPVTQQPRYQTVVDHISQHKDTITWDEAVLKIKIQFDVIKGLEAKNDRSGEEKTSRRALVAYDKDEHVIDIDTASSSSSSSHDLNNPQQMMMEAFANFVSSYSGSSSSSSSYGPQKKNKFMGRGRSSSQFYPSSSSSSSSSRPSSGFLTPCKWCHATNPTHKHRECARAPTCHTCQRKGHLAKNCFKGQGGGAGVGAGQSGNGNGGPNIRQE